MNLMNLSQTEYPNTNFSLYFDNFFSSPILLVLLSQNQLKGTGTIRENRLPNCTLPSTKSMKKECRGTYHSVVDEKNNIIAVQWNDNSTVTDVSNESGVHPIGTADR